MEDKKYPVAGYAPGSYQCKCADCGVIFLGDKRAIQCEPCATEAIQEYDSLTPKQKARYDSDRAQIFKLFMELRTLKQQIATSQPTSGQAVWVKATNPWREEDENSSLSSAQSGNASQSLLRETIEDILLKTGKHNQEECTELADAVLWDIPCAQSGKDDFVNILNWLSDKYHFSPFAKKWEKNNNQSHYEYLEMDELYELFKKQSNK